MTSIRDFARFKAEGRKISMVTAYDAWTARLVARSRVDAVLVGDSAAMVMHGHATTLPVTVRQMALHTSAVARVLDGKFLVADLPFLSVRKGRRVAMDAVGALMTSGAHAVKIEGVDGHEAVIRHIVESGVPVMGHVGLTPQAVHGLGGFHVQGRSDDEAAHVRRQAKALERLGCFALVLECVPARLATCITREAQIATIGIGAGAGTDGQILVLQDLWGVPTTGHVPRFVRSYLDGERVLTDALDRYDTDVKGTRFPCPEESYP